MRIKNKELRRRRHRKEVAIKLAVKEAKGSAKAPKRSVDAPTAKPAAKRPAPKKPAAAKKSAVKKKAEPAAKEPDTEAAAEDPKSEE